MKKSTFFYLLVLAGWVLLVFTFSSQSYEQQSIKPLLHRIFQDVNLSYWMPDITLTYNGTPISAKLAPYNFIEFIFRKSAHMFVYGMMAALLLLFLRSIFTGRPFLATFLTLAATFAAAGLDEWNQYNSDSRTGNMTDVWIDMTGAAIAITLTWILIGLFKKRARRRRSRRR
ncbi:VanZ family protein [Paenibacillus daejeonensis]|uniref:VanZ family protein n=1 Tax=Paenibacillus daejeonensis TaxID=135193 RepID=UPI00036DA795|nr:VanZ family protein [Paenibacillus daejeonensis]